MNETTSSPSDEGDFRMLAGALVLLPALHLLALGGRWNPVALSLAGAMAMTVALWRVHRRPAMFWTGTALLVVALGGGWWVSEHAASGIAGSPFHAPFFFFVAASVLFRVLQAKRVTEDTLLGSACAYILLSLAFASAYQAVEFLTPGAIAGIDTGPTAASLFSQLVYFSFVTITTLGYGDLSPVHPFCQSLAIVESVVGVLFPALIVARIIGVQAAGGTEPLGRPDSKWTREGFVARILVVFLPVIILALPWVQGTKWGPIVVGGLLLFLMIAGVYFISGRRRVLVVGGILALTALGLRIVGNDFLVFAMIIEVTLIAVVVARMSLWFFRRRDATTSVILAAGCIYWLIGIGFGETFALISRLVPNAIEGGATLPLGTTLYFSFMTLTTTGYGDFAPTIALTRTLASLEAFVGIFYPAIVIAKLVSLYSTRDRRSVASDKQDPGLQRLVATSTAKPSE